MYPARPKQQFSYSFAGLTGSRCIAICFPLKSGLILTRMKAKAYVLVSLLIIACIQIAMCACVYDLNPVSDGGENNSVQYQCNMDQSRYYNLFDERESGSSQILCSYLTMRSRVRYDTNNLA